MSAEAVEIIRHGDSVLAYIVRANWLPAQTSFVTSAEDGLQLGMIAYKAGQAITPHVHLPVERHVRGTPECLVVRQGACEVDIYSDAKELLCSRALAQGDVILLLGGGHGFRMQEDTSLLEVKQGPYAGMADKVRF